MAFKILDVDKFIKEKHAERVSNPISFDRDFEPTPDGLQSKTIFGISTKDKFQNYGYIDLKNVILHPLIYKNLSKVNTVFNKVLNKKAKFAIEDGVLIPNENGNTGLSWLIENWDSINFNKYKTEKNKLFIDFIKRSQKNLLIIDKVPVIPVVYREADTTGKIIKDNEIDEIYKKILTGTESGNSFSSSFLEASGSTKKENIQKQVNQLYQYFIKNLESKRGFFRNALAGKRLDNVARMVANARPDIPVDCVAIPWHILLNVFDVYVVGFLQQDENQEYAKKLGVQEMYSEEFGEIFDFIYRNVDVYLEHHKEKSNIWIQVLIDVFNLNPHLRVLLKRDPGWNADSFHCLKPIIRTGISYEIIINSIYYSPLGGDSFNSNFIPVKEDSNKLYEDNDYIINIPKNKLVIKTMDSIYKRSLDVSKR